MFPVFNQTCVAEYLKPCQCCALTASWEPDAGDTVGALLNRTTKTISFIKNGLDLGVAFNNVNESLLYPSVGMRTPNEEVCLESWPLSSILSLAYDMQFAQLHDRSAAVHGPKAPAGRSLLLSVEK